MRSDNTGSRFKALMKSAVSPLLFIATIAIFGLSQWATGYEIVPHDLVIYVFVICSFIVLIALLVTGLFTLLLIGKNSISCDNQGKFIHRFLLGTRGFFFGTAALILYLPLGVLAERLQRQEQFELINFSSGNLIEMFLLILGLYFFAVTFLFRIEYDDDIITRRTALLLKETHKWSDMKEVKEDSGDEYVILTFSNSGRVEVSKIYEAHDQIVNFAKSKLKNA